MTRSSLADVYLELTSIVHSLRRELRGTTDVMQDAASTIGALIGATKMRATHTRTSARTVVVVAGPGAILITAVN